MQVFSCECCEIFKNIYFEKRLQMVASDMILQTPLMVIPPENVRKPQGV